MNGPTKEQIAFVARCCHEANRAYCCLIGDFSQPAWELAPVWQTESAMNGIRLVLDQPEVTPELLHENWLKQKEVDGWVYGITKDADKKTHPCIVPYADLAPEQQKKDAIFMTVAKGMLKVIL